MGECNLFTPSSSLINSCFIPVFLGLNGEIMAASITISCYSCGIAQKYPATFRSGTSPGVGRTVRRNQEQVEFILDACMQAQQLGKWNLKLVCVCVCVQHSSNSALICYCFCLVATGNNFRVISSKEPTAVCTLDLIPEVRLAPRFTLPGFWVFALRCMEMQTAESRGKEQF